jgi:hypothetical protein
VRELGFAWAGTGQLPRWLALADAQVARLEAAGEHALLAHAHEFRAIGARMARDHSLLAHALVAMRDAAEQAGSTTVIEQAAKATQASLRATSDLEIVSMVSSLVAPHEGEFPSDETPANGIPRSRRRTLLLRVMERARAQAALVFTAGEQGTPRLLGCAGDAQNSAALTQAVAPLLAAPEDYFSLPLDPPALLIEGVSYDVMYLPRMPDSPRLTLMLLARERRPEHEVPMTMLARLAERVQSELSISQDPGDSLPDSEVSETTG